MGTLYENREIKVNYLTKYLDKQKIEGQINIINKTPFFMNLKLKCHNQHGNIFISYSLTYRKTDHRFRNKLQQQPNIK